VHWPGIGSRSSRCASGILPLYHQCLTYLAFFNSNVFFVQVKVGLQLYQVDHRSYLLDFRNLNTNIDHLHPALTSQIGLLFCLFLLIT